MKALLIFSFLSWSLNGMAAFQNKLLVDHVDNSRDNQMASNADAMVKCDTFKGTFHGNTVELKPTATGGSGYYSHRLVWQLSESYVTFDGDRAQEEVYVRDGRTYSFEVPMLKNEVSFVQQSVLLITQDLKTGKSTTSQLMFNVSRPIVLSQSNKPEKLKNNCFQVMPAMESVAGILTNGSTNPSQILIRQGVQSIWSRTRGSQWGFFISPLAWTALGNIFSVYKNYFTQYSRQTQETVEVSNEYQVAPGDYIQLYEQRTRYVTVFDAFEVDSCGETNEVDGDYYLQWWGVAYHAIPVNPYSTERAPRETIGIAPTNNCPAELTPEFARDNNDYIFARTN